MGSGYYKGNPNAYLRTIVLTLSFSSVSLYTMSGMVPGCEVGVMYTPHHARWSQERRLQASTDKPFAVGKLVGGGKPELLRGTSTPQDPCAYMILECILRDGWHRPLGVTQATKCRVTKGVRGPRLTTLVSRPPSARQRVSGGIVHL